MRCRTSALPATQRAMSVPPTSIRGLQDSLAPETEAFAKLLAVRGIAHSLVALAGDHEQSCWKQAFEHTLPVLKDHLRRVEPGE